MTTPTMPPAGGASTPHPAPPPAGLLAAAPPSRGFAYAVAAVAVLVVLGQVAAAVTAMLLQTPLIDAIRGGDVDRATSIGARLDVVSIVAFLLWAVAFVVTGIWLVKLRRFAERVNPHFHHRRRTWWAFGGWLVPIVSLWFPLQYLGDLRDALRPNEHSGRLFGWWWAAFLVSLVAGRFAEPDVTKIEGLENLTAGATAYAVALAVTLVLWLAVVRRLATAVDEVPEDVLRGTAVAADPSPYDPRQTAPGAPIYGPGPLSGPPSSPAAGPTTGGAGFPPER